MPELGTISDALALIKRELREAGVANADIESRQLLCGAGLAAEALITEPDRQLSPDQVATVVAWLNRRRAREPLARIAGCKEFYGREFLLSSATLEPRPDTEILIDVALELINSRPDSERGLRLLDIGTGSGCLLVTLLAELPHASGLGTDISLAAIATAKRNAEALGVGDRATWATADYLSGIEQQFDVIVANPPYVRSNELPTLEPEVALFDPQAALDGGQDGLDAYRKIAWRLKEVMPAGICVLEVAGNDAERTIAAMIDCAGSSNLRERGVWPDLTGMQRCVALETL